MWDVLAVGLGALALGVPVFSIHRSNLNSSVSSFLALNEGFRQAWVRYIHSDAEQRDHEFAELMNLLEIACAVQLEGSLFGVSRELTAEYIKESLTLLDEHEDARVRYERAIHSPTTFKYIRMFRARMRRERARRQMMRR